MVTKGGTLATTGMPASASGNAFNADNAMIVFNGQALTYDLNGKSHRRRDKYVRMGRAQPSERDRGAGRRLPDR